MLNISVHVISGAKITSFSNMVSEVYLLTKLLLGTDSKETKKLYDIFLTPSTTQEELIDKANFLLNEIDSELKLLLEVKEFIDKFNPCLTSDEKASDESVANESIESDTSETREHYYPYPYSYPKPVIVGLDLADSSDSSAVVTTISTTEETRRGQRANVFVSSSNHYTSFYNFYNPYFNTTYDTQQNAQDTQNN